MEHNAQAGTLPASKTSSRVRLTHYDSVLNEIKRMMIRLYSVIGRTPLSLEDKDGVFVWAVPATASELPLPYTFSLDVHDRSYGLLKSLVPLSETDEAKALLLKLALALSELYRWALLESERRGLIVEQVISEGLTAKTQSLLNAHGLDGFMPSGLIGIGLEERALLYDLQSLRNFFLLRLWQYKNPFPFVCCRPGLVLGILPKTEDPILAEQMRQWLHRWREETNLKARAVIVPIRNLSEVSAGIKQINTTLQRTPQWGMEGVIYPTPSQNVWDYMEHFVDRKTVSNLCKDVLGPLLRDEHHLLLDTLKVYLQEGQNVNKSAELLHVHRNTVLYRIAQVEKLLGFRLKNTDALAALWVALRGMDLLAQSSR